MKLFLFVYESEIVMYENIRLVCLLDLADEFLEEKKHTQF